MTNFVHTFYSHYNTDWITNMEIGLDPINSVIKRLWCTSPVYERYIYKAYIVSEFEKI